MTSRAQSTRGFTLLEMLVVITITGMLASVLIQGFSSVLATWGRVSGIILDLEKRILDQNIMAEPLTGVIPDYRDQKDIFKGEQRRLRGLTLRPLNQPTGVPAGFGLYFEYDTAADQTTLVYLERGFDPVNLVHWDGNSGSFEYLGKSGEWEPTWPPKVPDAPQTPTLIKVATEESQLIPTMVVRVFGPHNRRLRIEDVPGATMTSGR